MRHGHEMLWFSRGSFSESELPLSYNAKVTNARASNNWLRDQPFEQGMIIYIYIYTYILKTTHLVASLVLSTPFESAVSFMGYRTRLGSTL